MVSDQKIWSWHNLTFIYYFSMFLVFIKGGFFQKVWFFFQISKSQRKITPNHYPELEIWISCLLLWARISNFKFRIVIWSNLFWRFEKTDLTFWKKATFRLTHPSTYLGINNVVNKQKLPFSDPPTSLLT